MYQLLVEYTESGKRYTFKFDELVKDVLSDKQIAKIKAIALKEITKLL